MTPDLPTDRRRGPDPKRRRERRLAAIYDLSELPLVKWSHIPNPEPEPPCPMSLTPEAERAAQAVVTSLTIHPLAEAA